MKKFLLFILFAFLAFTLFFKLNFTALQSYDEAWYGDIARNILRTGNPFLLQFNGGIYTDHPPLGFMLMAIPALLFGSNEFTVRCVSALLGVLTLILLYVIGKEIKNAQVGVSAALILWSSLWFLLRARSGNLDVPFVFWEVLTFYFLVKIRKDPRFLFGVGVSFACLFLTKTLVGVGMLPVILWMIFQERRKISISLFLKTCVLLFIFIAPWYMYNQSLNHSFLRHHFLEVGTRGQENHYSIEALQHGVNYLQICLGKWFKVFLLSIPLSILLFWKKKKLRFLLIALYVWLGVFGIPFLLSSKTEIWHLLPLLPPIAVVTALSFQPILDIEWKPIRKYHQFLSWGVVGAMILLASFQFSQIANLLYPSQPVFSGERDIAQKAHPYSMIYLMDTFYPATVYYSQREVNIFYWNANAYEKMIEVLKRHEGKVFLINKDTMEKLSEEQVIFTTLEKNEQYSLIR